MIKIKRISLTTIISFFLISLLSSCFGVSYTEAFEEGEFELDKENSTLEFSTEHI